MASLMGVGIWLSYKLSFTQDVRKFMIFVIMNIAIPALILNGFFQVTIDQNLITQMMFVFIYSFIFNFVILFLGWIISKGFGFESRKAGESAFLSTFCNAGLIGIPLCVAIFGPKGAVLAAVFDAGMHFSLWTLGIFMLQENKVFTLKSLRSMITTPFISILIGIAITLIGITPHLFIRDLMSTVGGAASPLAMFYIGMLIMTLIQNKHKVSMKLISVPISLKLIVFPIAGMMFLPFLPFHMEVKQQLVVMMALPALTITSVIMAHHNADENYGVIHTLLTTVISLVTIPLILLLGDIVL